MVPNLETIKGGGGSIKVGTTGTISTLMSRELESPKQGLPPIKTSTFSESVSIPRKPKTKQCENRIKPHNRRSSQLPMLDSDDVSLEATPHRGKVDRKGGLNIVEIVDLNCGNADRAWATPIANKLKKLGFSKLSENNIV